MATNSHAHVHQKPIQILWNLNNQRTHPRGSETESPKAVVASRQTPLSLVLGKLRDSDHGIVLQAVEELRAQGHLNDNTLPWICLQYVNLLGANLSTVNFQNADLHKANLEKANLSFANLNCTRLTRAKMRLANLDQASLNGANLIGADLKGAKNVSNEQLAQAGRMRASVLPDGTMYDGRFNLPGDFAGACILHVDLNSPTAIATFYGVSLDRFLRGQEWRREHLPSISAWHESAGFQNAELIMTWL